MSDAVDVPSQNLEAIGDLSGDKILLSLVLDGVALHQINPVDYLGVLLGSCLLLEEARRAFALLQVVCQLHSFLDWEALSNS